MNGLWILDFDQAQKRRGAIRIDSVQLVFVARTGCRQGRAGAGVPAGYVNRDRSTPHNPQYSQEAEQLVHSYVK